MRELMVDFSYTFLPKLLNMTLTASVAIVAVLILRLCLKRAPKAASYALWAIVLIRLLCPVSVQSNLSVLNLVNAPSSERGASAAVMEYIPETIVHTAYPTVHLPVPGLSEVINEQLPQGHEQVAADPLEFPMSFATDVWLLGVIGMILYSVLSYIRLRRQLRFSVPLRENIRLTDRIPTPFVIGFIRPTIYLPAGLSGREQEYILLHEQCHIRRLDHLVKLFSFLALTVHWFNPLVWLAFVLAERDMEMSCDEAVVRRMGEDIRADYSASLLALSTGHRWIAGTPLAFGEGNPAGRIRNLAKWKKPALWVAVAAVLICGIAAVCLLTNPRTKEYRIRVTIPAHTENALYYSDEQIRPYSKSFTVGLDGGEVSGETVLYLGKVPERDDIFYNITPEEIPVTPGTPAVAEANPYTWYRLGLALDNTTDEPMNVYVTVRNVEVRIADYAEEPASPVGKWLDFYTGYNFSKNEPRETTVAEFPGVTFRWTYETVEAVTETGSTVLYSGMPVWNVYFCDLTGDGLPELCSTIAYGSGIIDERVIVYDYAAGESWELSDRMQYNYRLTMESNTVFGNLHCIKMEYETGNVVQVGPLMLTNAGNGRRLEIAEPSVKMEPYDTEMTGAVDNFLFIPMDGGIVRYRQMAVPAANEKKYARDELLYSFTEKADPENVNWKVYTLKGYPDCSVVLAEAGEDFLNLYEYAVPQGTSEEMPESLKAQDYLVVENGTVTAGMSRLEQFLKQTEKGKPASMKMAHWHTLDPDRCDEAYYEANRADYPLMFDFDLSFDGEVYSMDWTEITGVHHREYRYLRAFERTIPSALSSVKPQKAVTYVLTSDEQATWEELQHGLTSSQLGDFVPFMLLCTVKAD